jgi:DNA repair exonuclease SbcCD ATPase subunit
MSKDIKELENSLNDLTSKLGSIKGQFSLLTEQVNKSEFKLIELEDKKELYKKSVELLTIVEQNTKEHIKKGFEQIVSYALQYILSNDEYALELEFGRRGNLSEIYFNTLTPKNKEPHEPGGLVTDILALALRLSLIELTQPKIEGFIALDEPFSAIDSSDKLERARKFIKTMTRKLNRQIIISTHKQDFITDADKAIKIGE